MSNEHKSSLLDLLLILLRHRRFILSFTILCAVGAAITSILLPKVYRAEARILPTQNNTSLSAQLLSEITGDVYGLAGQALGLGDSASVYVGMLKSRTLADRVISRFNLKELYHAEYIEEAREDLAEHVEIESDLKSGIIRILVEDRDPSRSADMANAFVEELTGIARGLALTEAAQKRLFFEEQLRESKAELSEAENAMKKLQEESGILQVEEQAKAIIGSIADLRARIAMGEIELKVMRTYSAERNPDLLKMEKALVAMKEELRKLENNNGAGFDPIIPAGKLPSVGIEYLRKLRELKFSETLHEMMLKQRELARLEESRNPALIQIIDKAVPPERRYRPRRTVIVIASTASGFWIGVLISFLREFISRLSADPEQRTRLDSIRDFIRLK